MKQLELPKTNILYNDIHWISQPVDYKKYSIPELQKENGRILQTLKVIEHKISKELEAKNKNKVYSSRVQNN